MPRYVYLSIVACFVATLGSATALYVLSVPQASDVFKLAALFAVYIAGIHTTPPGAPGGSG